MHITHLIRYGSPFPGSYIITRVLLCRSRLPDILKLRPLDSRAFAGFRIELKPEAPNSNITTCSVPPASHYTRSTAWHVFIYINIHSHTLHWI